MSYKIAVASSDGENVDLHFGAAASFLIYDVFDDKTFTFVEKRTVPSDELLKKDSAEFCDGADADKAGSCGKGSGCAGSGTGCAHGGAILAGVELLSDCRSIVAAKIGFNVQKQLERKAIAAFDVQCSVQEALEKIINYFYSVDNHISLAKK